MTLNIITDAHLGFGLAAGDGVYLTQTGSIFTPGSDSGIYSYGGATMLLAGSVIGAQTAILLTRGVGATSGTQVTVAATGVVYGVISGIFCSDQGGLIENFGLIKGDVNGVEFGAPSSWSGNTLRNHGSIQGANGILIQESGVA